MKNRIAEKWTGANCTLDGKPAIVTGRLLPFGYIHEICSGYGKSVEYAWETIENIMRKDGSFTS